MLCWSFRKFHGQLAHTHTPAPHTSCQCCSESSTNMWNKSKSKTIELATELANGARVATMGFRGSGLQLWNFCQTQQLSMQTGGETWMSRAGRHKEKGRQEDRGCPSGKVLQPVSWGRKVCLSSRKQPPYWGDVLQMVVDEEAQFKVNGFPSCFAD